MSWKVLSVQVSPVTRTLILRVKRLQVSRNPRSLTNSPPTVFLVFSEGEKDGTGISLGGWILSGDLVGFDYPSDFESRPPPPLGDDGPNVNHPHPVPTLSLWKETGGPLPSVGHPMLTPSSQH